jgi:TATA-binding protein-associated factor Taf7
MNIKLSKLIMPVIALGALLIPTFQSVALASLDEHHDQKQISPEKMHEHMKARLDKLAARLEIKASQQAAWEQYAKSVESLADRGVKRPSHDADAATISRYRADRATEFAKKLAVIADATDKLQKALTEDQRKILNQVSRRLGQHHHKHHGWHGTNHEQAREGHEWNHGSEEQ